MKKFLSLAVFLLGSIQFLAASRTFADEVRPGVRLTNVYGVQASDRLIYDCGVFQLVEKEQAKEGFLFQIPVDSLDALKQFGDENKCDVLNIHLTGRRADGAEVKFSAPVKFGKVNLKNEPIRSLVFVASRDDLPDGTYEVKITDGTKLKPAKNKNERKLLKEKSVVGSFKNVVVAWQG